MSANSGEMSQTITKPQKIACYSKAMTEVLAAQQKLGKAMEKLTEHITRLEHEQQQPNVNADNNTSEQAITETANLSNDDSTDVEIMKLQGPLSKRRGRHHDRAHDRAHSRGRDRAHSRGRSHGRSRSRSSSSSSDEEFSGHGMFHRRHLMHSHGPPHVGCFGGSWKHHKHHKLGKHGKRFMKALHGPWGQGRRLGHRVYY